MVSTAMGCATELHDQDGSFGAFFGSGPAVELDGDELILTGSDGATLELLDEEVAVTTVLDGEAEHEIDGVSLTITNGDDGLVYRSAS